MQLETVAPHTPHDARQSTAKSVQVIDTGGGYYETRNPLCGNNPVGFMKTINRLSIHFILALLSFLSLTLLPSIASPQSCCMSPSASAESCMCSKSADCCKESTPSSLAEDRSTVSVKPLRNAQVPYNAALWTPVSRLVTLAATQPVFRKPTGQVDSNNKRYLMLRVLLI